MKAHQFEELLFWKKSHELAIGLYRLFRTCRDFSFKDQILRASISVGNNIAEWFERQTNKEFRQFLYIAKWSCAEVRSMLHIGLKLTYLPQDEFDALTHKCIEISKMISGFIKSIEP